MCIDPSGGGGASSWKRFTISCYIFISPAGRSIFFCQFYLVLWSEKATVKWCRTSAPRLAWNASLSQVCEDLVVVYSLHSSIQGPWRQEIGIFNMSVFNRKAWISCPLSQSRRFHVCVCICIQENDQMTLPGLLRDLCDCHMQVLIREPGAEFIQDLLNSHRTF